MRGPALVVSVALLCCPSAFAQEEDPFADDAADVPARVSRLPSAEPTSAKQAGPPAKAPTAPASKPRTETADAPREPRPAPTPAPAPAPASAPTLPEATPGGIAVVISARDPGANESAALFEKALTAGLVADGRLEAIDLAERLGGEPEPVARPEVQRLLADARQAYDNLELDAAAAKYLEALKMMLEKPEAAVPPHAAHVFTLAGAAYMANAETERANASFRRAALLAPGYSPNAADFSPDIIEAYKAVRGQVAQGPKGNLTITANVSPATVVLDGEEAGVAPLSLKGLPAGRHHVLVKTRAYSPWAAFVEVGEGGSATAAAELRPLPPAHRFGRATELGVSELSSVKGTSGARELAELLGAQYVVVGAARSDAVGASVDLAVYDVAANRRAGGARKNVLPGAPQFDAEARALASQLVDELLRPAAIVEAPTGPSTPITERWWFWPAVGGAAAVAASAAIIAATSGTSPPPGLIITGVP